MPRTSRGGRSLSDGRAYRLSTTGRVYRSFFYFYRIQFESFVEFTFVFIHPEPTFAQNANDRNAQATHVVLHPPEPLARR